MADMTWQEFAAELIEQGALTYDEISTALLRDFDVDISADALRKRNARGKLVGYRVVRGGTDVKEPPQLVEGEALPGESPEAFARRHGIDVDTFPVERVTASEWAGKTSMRVEARRKPKMELGYEDFLAHLRADLGDHVSFTDVVKVDAEGLASRYMLEVNLPDLHIGNGEAPDETTHRGAIAAMELMLRAAHLDVRKVVIPVGNDVAHFDNERRTTTKGTPMEEASCDVWTALREAVRFYRIVTEYALDTYPDATISLVVTPGNHDRFVAFAVGEILAAAYKDNEDVAVYSNPRDPFIYMTYGDNLIGYGHGDGFEKKFKDLPKIMARDARQMWGDSRFRYFRLGHLHAPFTYYEGGVQIDFLPSLVHADKWHRTQGYSNPGAAQAALYHPLKGMVGTYIYNREDRG